MTNSSVGVGLKIRLPLPRIANCNSNVTVVLTHCNSVVTVKNLNEFLKGLNFVP